MKRDLRILPDHTTLAAEAAREIALRIGGARSSRERFSIALSGGSTPRELYSLLADTYGERISWEQVDLFWGDERYLPHDAPESNYRMAREAMLDKLPIPSENIHPIPTHFPDPDDAARAYEQTLRAARGSQAPRIDLIILGLGVDGHTASLFPGSAALAERERIAVATHAPAPPSTRITLTLPTLELGRTLLFLVSGSGKHSVLRTILDMPDAARDRYPAAMLEPTGETIWMVDRDAYEG